MTAPVPTQARRRRRGVAVTTDRAMMKSLCALALLAVTPRVFAQEPPSAGGQLLQIPPAPEAPRAEPEFRIEQRTAPEAAPADAVRIVVRSLRVTGATVFAEPDLIALTGFTPGSELALADLQAMAARITEHYHRHGYFVAQAYLPAQEIVGDSVTIAVSEGRYGNVKLRNSTNLSAGLAQRPLEGLNAGDVIANEPLQTRLLRLSDLPGVKVSSTLVPGAAPGTSDLLVDVTPGRRVTGSIDADNAGNRYTGEYRIGGTVYVNNPLGLGDVASLRALTSGSGLFYARAAYQIQLGRAQVGAAYSWLDYELSKEFEPLQAHGDAQIASLFARYPLIRSRNHNLYAQLAYDHKTFKDEVDLFQSVTERNSDVLMPSLYGDHRDRFGGGGLSSWSLTWSTGELDIETPAALAVDDATARSNGHFDKLAFNAARLQRLGGPFSLYAAVGGQFASKNLDVSEKMELGGMNAVRAYPEGEAYADEGIVGTLEARMDLPKFWASQPGYMQLIGLVDAGSVKIAKNPWTAGDNRRTLSGAGVGATWSDPGNFTIRTYYALKLGSEDALSAPDKSGRFWVQLIKYF